MIGIKRFTGKSESKKLFKLIYCVAPRFSQLANARI
jgi:hypothetical protein